MCLRSSPFCFIYQTPEKMRRKIIKIFCILAVSFFAVSLLLSIYMVDFALSPGSNTTDLKTRMAQLGKTGEQGCWLDSLVHQNAFRDTFIMGYDSMKLHAYYARSAQSTANTAIVIHGYGCNALNMLDLGHMFHHSLGYNILLPDLRYSGKTGGDAFQMGWLDRKDIERWISEAPAMFGDSVRLVIHGVSMGGATTMMTAGEQLPENVRCFIDDCGYTSVWDQFEKELNVVYKLPAFPILYMASTICSFRYGWNFKEASSVEQVRKCTRPMLFIHGGADDYVPTWMVHELYKAKPEPKELWIPEEAVHANSFNKYPKEYAERVKSFTDKYMCK